MTETSASATNGSALAIRAEQERFNGQQVEALKKMNGWDRVPEAELSVFFHQAQRTGLDPFAKQIYLIGRRNNRANRTDYTIQTSIDGMRLVADRTGRYAGSDRPIFGEDGGEKFCEVTVWKVVGGRRVPFTGVAYEAEFRQDRSPMWSRMPRTMLAKCAEAQALRKAFPADLSGIYGSEEMDQAGPVLEHQPQVEVDGEPEVEEGEQPEEEAEAEVVEEEPLASEKQAGYLKGLMREAGVNREKIEERHGPVEEWPASKASSWIETLQDRIEVKKADGADAPGRERGSGFAHDEQVEMILELAEKAGMDRDALDRELGHDLHALTKDEAKAKIDELRERAR